MVRGGGRWCANGALQRGAGRYGAERCATARSGALGRKAARYSARGVGRWSATALKRGEDLEPKNNGYDSGGDGGLV